MGLKTLVIDDSRVMRNMVMQTALRTELAEFEFVEAGDGKDALDKMQHATFQVAFVDWNMPNMTGIEFITKVRALPNADEILLIMVTSEKDSSKINLAMNQAGADGYIGKPFTVDDMKLKLRRLLPRIGVLPRTSVPSTMMAQ